MLYAGLDLSRKRLDFHLLERDGGTVEVGAAPPDVDGLRGLTQRLARRRADPRGDRVDERGRAGRHQAMASVERCPILRTALDSPSELDRTVGPPHAADKPTVAITSSCGKNILVFGSAGLFSTPWRRGLT
jgi:hypothetical protein